MDKEVHQGWYKGKEVIYDGKNKGKGGKGVGRICKQMIRIVIRHS